MAASVNINIVPYIYTIFEVQDQAEVSLSTQYKTEVYINWSSRPEVFCKKDVLENFAKFTWKHLCQSLFFNKVAGLRQWLLLNRLTELGLKTVNFWRNNIILQQQTMNFSGISHGYMRLSWLIVWYQPFYMSFAPWIVVCPFHLKYVSERVKYQEVTNVANLRYRMTGRPRLLEDLDRKPA